MEKLGIFLGLLGVDLVIVMAKYYSKYVYNINIISWKIFGIIQIPMLICFLLIVYSFQIFIWVFLIAAISCITFGLLFSYFGNKHTIESIEAEIIDINSVTITSNYNEKTIYILVLRYNINGLEYINKISTGLEKLDENMKIGNKIIIKYNPKIPKEIEF